MIDKLVRTLRGYDVCLQRHPTDDAGVFVYSWRLWHNGTCIGSSRSSFADDGLAYCDAVRHLPL